MTRVGLVVHGQPPELVGGTERLVADVAAELARRGHEVAILSGSIAWEAAFRVADDAAGPVAVRRLHRDDLYFERWDKIENPRVERAYLDWLDEFRPEVVHVHHWARLTTTLVRRAHERGLPVAASLHDLLPSCPRYHRVKADLSFCEQPPGPEACRRCAPRWTFQQDEEIDAQLVRFVAELRAELSAADLLLAPTEGHAERLLRWMGLRLPVTALAPAGGSLPAPAAPPLAGRAASANAPLRVCAFGHLHPLKGVEVLLDAQAALPDPALVELHVWGASPTPEMDAALRARAGSRAVVWHGAYGPADLSGAPIDVVVLPTLCAESWSLALDEAAALGVPILATDLGALADRATPRMALFPRGDARALAAHLQRLAPDPAARAAMSRAPGPASSSLSRHVDALAEHYARLTRRPRAARAPSAAAQAARLAEQEAAFARREAAWHEGLRSEPQVEGADGR